MDQARKDLSNIIYEAFDIQSYSDYDDFYLIPKKDIQI